MDADKYMCIGSTYQNNPTTVCRNWDEVWWNTGVNGYTHKQSTPIWKQLQDSIALIQGQSSPQPCRTGCIPLYLTFKDATPLMQGTYGLGADVSGTDPIHKLIPNTLNANLPSPAQSTPKNKTVSLRDSDEVIAVETGFTDTNRWIDWIHYTAHTLGAHDCYACCTAKPVLTTAPFPALLNDRHCVTSLLTILSHRSISNDSVFKPEKGNFTCFTQHIANGRFVGDFPHCTETYQVTDFPLLSFSTMLVARADIWWYCLPTTLRPTLPKTWTGTCAITVLTMPIAIITEHDHAPHPRTKRSTSVPGIFTTASILMPYGSQKGSLISSRQEIR
ncbi:hypothetical protein MHYP_G00086480 [Metynnis hypsauchen]